VFCSDDNYTVHLAVAIRSLVLNCLGKAPLDIHVLSAGISPEKRFSWLSATGISGSVPHVL
jgi:lipopolysaccharide biosynthesis glycosyltransferase